MRPKMEDTAVLRRYRRVLLYLFSNYKGRAAVEVQWLNVIS